MAYPLRTRQSTIPFDEGVAFAYCTLPIPQTKFKVFDKFGRTRQEVEFLRAFVRIFVATSNGDLETCRDIIEKENFSDIDAYTIGKFKSEETGEFLDRVSVRQLAEMDGHTKITAYFLERFGNGPLVKKSN